ncbi:MAG: hypothetical protein LC742_10435 [Acidobacteria bacterium]|nr:hypothetical protein [Acidobacteriota bacterium]
MRNLITPAAGRQGRKDERGAALITALLISTLLLLAGGALVLATSLSSTTTLDSTAEMQAYYLAEAGLQDALRALRGNIQVNQDFNGASDRKINFRRAVDPMISNRNDDPFRALTSAGGRARLSRWLNYTDPTSATSVVPLGGNGGYVVEIIDPADQSGTTRENNANYIPQQLIIRSNGFGPKRTRKVMEMLVDRFIFSYDPPATLVLRESQNSTNVNIPSPGSGQPNLYSGEDNAPGSTIVKPVLGAGSTLINATTDVIEVTTKFSTENHSNPLVQPVGGGLGQPAWPSFLTSANDARAFLYGDGTDDNPGIVNYATTNGACPMATSTSAASFSCWAAGAWSAAAAAAAVSMVASSPLILD